MLIKIKESISFGEEGRIEMVCDKRSVRIKISSGRRTETIDSESSFVKLVKRKMGWKAAKYLKVWVDSLNDEINVLRFDMLNKDNEIRWLKNELSEADEEIYLLQKESFDVWSKVFLRSYMAERSNMEEAKDWSKYEKV